MQEQSTKPPMIQTALLGAMRDIARTGIAKLGKADAGGARYNFRGIDQAMNELSPVLVNNGITVTPSYSELTIQERAKDGGKFTRFATVKGSFCFSAEDGSSVTAEAYGEAMDSGDKATIKAQSVSFRTVLFQQFIVPLMAMDTEIDDGGSQEPQQPAGMDAGSLQDWLNTIADATADGLESVVREGMRAARDAGDKTAFDAIRAAGTKRKAALQ